MGFTQTQIDALEEAIAAGVTSVTYQGRTTEYRSLAEMKETLEMMKRSVNPNSAVQQRSSFAVFRRG